jgi:hypothetical protein
MGQVFALLVGINEYDAPVRKLAGCVNDVEHFEAWLREHVAGRGLAVEKLLDRDATRANVVAGFRRFLGRAGPGDVALFQFCGHGARTYSAPEFRPFFADGVDEGLVLFDSRHRGGHDLADKELAALIAELSRREAHVAFVLDSCHSGSGTRSVDAFAGLTARTTAPGPAGRPLESYLDGHYSERLKRGDSLREAPGRHILLAACERGQEAKESPLDRRGIFSRTLIEVLGSDGAGTLSYADIFVRCRAAVRRRALEQDPQFDCFGGFDAWSGFLGGALAARPMRHSVFFDGGGWKIDAGALHGLVDDPAVPVGLAFANEADTRQEIATGRVVEVGAQQSSVAFDGPEPAASMRLRARLTHLPAAPLVVHTPLSDSRRNRLQQALDGDGQPLGSSGVLLTGESDGLRHALVPRGGHLALRTLPLRRGADDGASDDADDDADDFDALPRAAWDDADPSAAARELRPALQAVARWERLLGLRNRTSGLDPATLDFLCVEPTGREERVHPGPVVTLGSVREAGEWTDIEAHLRARNRGTTRLYAALIYFSPAYAIDVMWTGWLEPGGGWVTLWGDATTFQFEAGREGEETIDRYKLVLSASEFDSFQLVQPALRAGASGTRASGPPRRRKVRADDWLALDLQVRVVPLEATVQASRDAILAGGAVRVRAHPRLRAQLNLASARPDTRGAAETAAFVAALEHGGLALAGLARTRAAGDQAVLELSGIEGADSLADEPLQIEVHQALDADEALVALAFDGHHVLPCGHTTRTGEGHALLTLDHLPQTEADSRSVGRALKLYFFKTVLKRQHVDRLRWLDFSQPDAPPAAREDGLASRVAAARRLLLLVHGWTGETDGMAAALPGLGLDRHFDLVLTYDYESLHTPIPETAARLRQRLEAAGLHAADDKHLALLTHSMGGLVSRWMIERDGGRTFVDHLVMCGTPNAGSPFGRLDAALKLGDYLFGLAVNVMPKVVQPLLRFRGVLGSLQQLTPALAQMDPGSDFLHELNASPDPGVRYTVLAGDVDAYEEPTDAFFGELLAKLGRGVAFDLLFGRGRHDIAVATESIGAVDATRAQPPRVVPVACHHLNYFESAAGRQALSEVDW